MTSAMPAARAEHEAAAAHPTVSVVIPTYRRDDLLRRCLAGILAQDYPREQIEIIVVDDAGEKTVPALVTEIAAAHPDVRLLAFAGQRSGPAAARNIGLRTATGEIVAFIDDDAYPANQGWLRAGIAPFADPRVHGVDGTVRVPVAGRPTDFQRNVQGLERGRFLTCNAFYRRSALERAGGFDERFRLPFREDSDLQFRVEQAGGLLVRAPSATVIHPAPPGTFGVSLRLQRYSMYNALIAKKHPARFRAELERRPPLHYYAIVTAALTAGALALTSHRRAALLPAALWATLTGRFLARRQRGTSRHPRHVLDMALTSVLIPPLSIYWRLRGAARFRVWFW